MMRCCELTHDEVVDALKDIPEDKPGSRESLVDSFFEETPGGPGIHFFKLEYDDGDVILPKGVYSDYAGVLLQGVIRVRHLEPATHRDAGGRK